MKTALEELAIIWSYQEFLRFVIWLSLFVFHIVVADEIDDVLTVTLLFALMIHNLKDLAERRIKELTQTQP